MKKTTALLLALTMLFCLAACSDTGSKSSTDLYKAFLEGKENIRGAMPGAWEEYDLETESYTPFLSGDISLSIEDLIKETNRYYELSGPDACASAVEYSFIDCGNDGEPELALQVKYPEETSGGWNVFIIKNIDGKLTLCRHAQSFYRYTDELFNKYGMFESSGSTGAGSMAYGQGFVDADGQYHCLYNSEYYWEIGSSWPFGEDLTAAAGRLDLEVPEDAAIILTTLRDYSEFDEDDYYDPASYMITLEAESEESLANALEIAKEAGLDIIEQSELDELLENRKLEFGLTEEMYNDHDFVEWTVLENDAIHDICAYGQDPVFCSTVDDFVAAVDDGAVIVLAPGEYNLTEWLVENGPEGKVNTWAYSEGENLNPAGVLCSTDFYDMEESGFIINNISNMKIVAEDPENLPHIISQPRYEEVISFQKCYNITLDGAVIGHTPEQGSCSGSVLGFTDCSVARVLDCDLYGCGTYGVEGLSSYGIRVEDSVIHDCCYGCAELIGCSSTHFKNTVFENCTGYDMFSVYGSYSTVFDGCTFRNLGSDMLYADADSTVLFFENNVFDANALTGFQNYRGDGEVTFY